MAKIDFGGVIEEVVTRDEFPLAKTRDVLRDEVVAVLGYGVQGPAQPQQGMVFERLDQQERAPRAQAAPCLPLRPACRLPPRSDRRSTQRPRSDG